jgi:glutamine cyclotransferase
MISLYRYTKSIKMNKRLFFSFIFLSFIGLTSCETKKQAAQIQFDVPKAGSIVRSGEGFTVKLAIPNQASDIDSIVYLIDGAVHVKETHTDSIRVQTHTLSYGNRVITAKVYKQGNETTIHSNIVYLPTPAKQYGFKVINEYPHDPEGFTQGLEYHQGVLYESTGQYEGKSSLRKVALESGKILQKINLDAQYFGEGMTIIDQRIIQLTWMEGKGFVYNKHSFEKIGEFPYGSYREGWGLCYDGNRLILSDGTNKLYFLNKDTYQEEGSIAVYNHQGPVKFLNELEYIDGKVYANVYQKDIIVVIDPNTGAIEKEINLSGIYPEKNTIPYDNELNGIAYDPANKRLFVTGKNWSKLFEIELIAR